MISLESQFTENYYYEASFAPQRNDVGQIIEKIQNGNHQVAIDYLNQGGSLNDCMQNSYRSIGYYCFDSLSVPQIREIINALPQDTELPWDTALAFEEDQIDRFLELLPDLKRLKYSFDVAYERAIDDKELIWIDFFLSHPISGLNLNQPLNNDFHMLVHPYTEMKIFAGQLALNAQFMKVIPEMDLVEAKIKMSQMKEHVEQILQQMENHPGIDLHSAQEEMDWLRKKGFYFVGDPAWQRDIDFFIDATTYEGLEKQVASGFNLYESIGPFSLNLGSGIGDCTWIELLCYFFKYGEAELVDLMVKYHPQL